MEETVNIFKRKYKYAADYGFILGGYIAVFFILDFLFQNNAFVGILETLGLLCTPIVCYYISKQYRDKAWGGYIRFGQVWSFGIWLFLFAGLLMAVFYYIRFQFLQPNYIAEQVNQSLFLAEKLYTKEQMELLTSSGIPSAIQVVLASLWFYILGGAILFLIISPMIARKNPEETNQNSGTVKTYEPYEENKDKNEKSE